VDKDNVKALFRGGQAALKQDNFEEAELALREAAKLAPKDPLVRAAVQDLQRKRAEYVEKEKRMMKKMGGFLMTPAATGIKEEEGGKGKGKEDEQVESEEKEGEDVAVVGTMTAVAAAAAAAGHSKPEEEEEEEEVGEEEQPLAQAAVAAAAAEQVEARPINPWLAWYIEHYDWCVTAAFLILPVLFVWEDLKASWARRMGGGGGGESGGAGSDF